MNDSAGDPTGNLLSKVLLPVANEADAEKSARALKHYDPEHVVALHVVEKGEGVPDKTPVAQSEEIAEKSYAAVREIFPEATDHTEYRRDVVEAIYEAAEEIDATSIAFRSRAGNRLLQFLSGDTTLRLVTNAPLPVISLPEESGE